MSSIHTDLPARPTQIFIGSSSESSDLVDALSSLLSDPTFVINPWRVQFELSAATLSSLLLQLDRADFGVFIFHPDDAVEIRGEALVAARDNVVLEYGMFLGRLGQQRSIAVVPQAAHVPSDLRGLTFASYDASRIVDLNVDASPLGAAATEIRRHVKSTGARVRPVDPVSQETPTPAPPLSASAAQIEDGWSYMLRNNLLSPVLDTGDLALGSTLVHPLRGGGRVVGFDPPGPLRSVVVQFADGIGVYPLAAKVLLAPAP